MILSVQWRMLYCRPAKHAKTADEISLAEAKKTKLPKGGMTPQRMHCWWFGKDEFLDQQIE